MELTVTDARSSHSPAALRLDAKAEASDAMTATASFILVGILALLAAPATAGITLTDVQVAARALTFMEKPLTGSVRVGILYSPVDPRSLREAEDLQRLLGDGLKVGNLELKPFLVKIGDAADVDLFFLSTYVDDALVRAAALASKRKPCITIDIVHVESGTCVMAVRSAPKVQIVVSRSAAKESGIVFATVFRVMISEL